MDSDAALIGARLAVGIPGTEATDDLIAHLRAIQAKSLVLFARNFVSPEQLTRLIQALEAALGWRLLVMVDHEGGRVIRFKTAVTRFPDALTVGGSATPQEVEQQGVVEANELKRLGVHVNLAPCVDVLVEGADPIIGDRSYGSDPERVSALGVARIQGLQSHGVAACAKHFPGLGAVSRDPHKTLSDILLDQQTMHRVHLAPFSAAIEARVAMVMSSHVRYAAFGDPAGRPATFSVNIIRSLLRAHMGFTGLILTDDLAMGAIREQWSVGRAAVRAVHAGHDLLLICSEDLRLQKEALASLRQAYHEGQLDDPEELKASAERIRQVREKFLA